MGLVVLCVVFKEEIRVIMKVEQLRRERERVFAGESDCGGADETSPKVSISQLACSASEFYSVKLL